MKYIQFLFICMTLWSCSKIETVSVKDQPTEVLSICMEEKILTFEESEFNCETGAAVAKYNFQDSLVYLFSPGICIADGMTEVTNNSCETLGFLGGIAGFSVINGEEFWVNSQFVANIWEN